MVDMVCIVWNVVKYFFFLVFVCVVYVGFWLYSFGECESLGNKLVVFFSGFY